MRGGGLTNSKTRKNTSDLGRAVIVKGAKLIEVRVSMPSSVAGRAKALSIKRAMNELLEAPPKRAKSPKRKKSTRKRGGK